MARLRRDTLQPPVAPPLRIFATGTVFLTHSLLVPVHPHPGSVSRAQSVNTTRGGAAAHVLALLAQLAVTIPAAGDVEPMLIASLGGNTDAARLRDSLEADGVRTKYCKIWTHLGVPAAWVVHARDTDVRTVVNHNPLPEVSHEDFIALLGPVLAPENYIGLHLPQPPSNPPPIPREQQSPSPIPVFPNSLAPPSAPRPSTSARPASSAAHNAPPPSPHSYNVPSPSLHSPAPFDWLHFEGRSVRTTLANLIGIDGLARERKWRSHCVISVDLGRRARDGVHALIPHADVIFLATTTFASPASPTQLGQASSVVSIPPGVTPRAILLSLARHASPHALLVLNAGREGAALLSLPTSEYLQSSGWSPPNDHILHHAHRSSNDSNGTQSTRPWDGAESVRSASDFWAGGGGGNNGNGNGLGGGHNASFTSQDSAYSQRSEALPLPRPSGESFHPMDDDDDEEEEIPTRAADVAAVAVAGGGGAAAINRNGVHRNGRVDPDEDGRRTPQPQQMHEREKEDVVLDEEGAHAAFVAGMIWALSRRVLPGPPYAPGFGMDGEGKGREPAVDLGIRWRLDECLRFATELAGRKAYTRTDDIGTASVASSAKERGEWDGLAQSMRRAGWFD